MSHDLLALLGQLAAWLTYFAGSKVSTPAALSLGQLALHLCESQVHASACLEIVIQTIVKYHLIPQQKGALGRRRDEVKIARSAQNKKMRIGEGGSGTVYKALMHGCDEVAVKVVRTAQPAPDEALAFQKEVGPLLLPGWVGMLSACKLALSQNSAAAPTENAERMLGSYQYIDIPSCLCCFFITRHAPQHLVHAAINADCVHPPACQALCVGADAPQAITAHFHWEGMAHMRCCSGHNAPQPASQMHSPVLWSLSGARLLLHCHRTHAWWALPGVDALTHLAQRPAADVCSGGGSCFCRLLTAAVGLKQKSPSDHSGLCA